VPPDLATIGADALFIISNLLITSLFAHEKQGPAGGVFNSRTDWPQVRYYCRRFGFGHYHIFVVTEGVPIRGNESSQKPQPVMILLIVLARLSFTRPSFEETKLLIPDTA
jgi:hypothetical protein